MEPSAAYAITPPDNVVADHIHAIRGQKVMLDRDLAELYGVETKKLNQAVRRNVERFPLDFMFQLTEEEAEASRSQFVTLKQGQNLKYLPYAFTEHGILMLSSVLRSPLAIQVNIHIIRVFTRMREALLSNKDILQKLERLEEKVTDHEGEIQELFDHITEMVAPPEAPRNSIGFKPYDA